MSGWTFSFWAALAFAGYTYVGYPLIVWALSRLHREPAPSDPAEWPEVTVVIAAYNERERALRKVANLRALDYPADKLHIVFACDGCTDGSEAALSQLPGVRVVSYQPRQGKPYGLNQAMKEVRTPVVVFADVRQQLEPQAVKALVRRLLQPGVGAVSGELVHLDPATNMASHIGLYWRYEKWIRGCESRLASTAGVTGALYAIRREHFTALPPDTLLDDVVQPMHIVRRGLRVLFESRALVYDELQEDIAGERKRKVRTLTGNFQVFARYPWTFLPGGNPVWFQFLSHKVFRLLVPYALVVLLLASLFAPGWFYKAAFAAQFAFYAAAFGGSRSQSLRKLRLVSFATVFTELNWAAVLGLRNFLRGQMDARWERTT
jgi:cellulose synthase/poly-beta-1,6-N-acetylglucosamine synthase-like glycosyltransferase